MGKRVGRILKAVRSDLPFGPALHLSPGDEVDMAFNPHGAASAVFEDGEKLGLKPDEYEELTDPR